LMFFEVGKTLSLCGLEMLAFTGALYQSSA